MFFGEYHLKIDAKGRASVPKELRDVLLEQYGDEAVVVTKSVRRGLLAYPAREFASFRQDLINQDDSPQKTAMMRLMLTPAAPVAFDQLGRLPIPRSLRLYAQLNGDDTKDIVVVGMENRIEIWDAAIYDQVVTESEARLLESPDYLSRFGM